MIDLQNIGSYLGRQMVLGQVMRPTEETDALQLIDATILVLYGESYTGSELDRQFLVKLTLSSPLAIAVGGSGARKAFDALIDISSKAKSHDHIMTGLFEDVSIDDAIEQFLFSTWPAEERFDDWKKVAILTIGNGHYLETVKREAEKKADERR